MSSTASAESFSGEMTPPFVEAIQAEQGPDITVEPDIAVSPSQALGADEPPSGIHDPVFPVVVIGAISLLAILLLSAFLAL